MLQSFKAQVIVMMQPACILTATAACRVTLQQLLHPQTNSFKHETVQVESLAAATDLLQPPLQVSSLQDDGPPHCVLHRFHLRVQGVHGQGPLSHPGWVSCLRRGLRRAEPFQSALPRRPLRFEPSMLPERRTKRHPPLEDRRRAVDDVPQMMHVSSGWLMSEYQRLVLTVLRLCGHYRE